MEVAQNLKSHFDVCHWLVCGVLGADLAELSVARATMLRSSSSASIVCSGHESVVWGIAPLAGLWSAESDIL